MLKRAPVKVEGQVTVRSQRSPKTDHPPGSGKAQEPGTMMALLAAGAPELCPPAVTSGGGLGPGRPRPAGRRRGPGDRVSCRGSRFLTPRAPQM